MACAACARSSTLGFGLREACQTCRGYKNVILDQSIHVSLRFGGLEIFVGRAISSSQARLLGQTACAACAAACAACATCARARFPCAKKNSGFRKIFGITIADHTDADYGSIFLGLKLSRSLNVAAPVLTVFGSSALYLHL